MPFGDRVPLWISLKRMSTQVSGPWLVGGDNCVLQAKERLGGSFNMAEAEPFQQCLEDCEVMDIQATRSFYTWNNKQPVETRVYSRLDKALVNQHWTDPFPTVYAIFLPEGHFDHNPCLIGLADSGQHRNMPFKYFNMWSLSPDFHNCVSSAWQYRYEGTKMFRVIQKLKRLKPALKSINMSCYSNIENQAMLAETQLFQLQQLLAQNQRDKDIMAQEYAAHQKSGHLQQAKVEFLKQKAKAHWLEDGDTNSSYFHRIIKARRNKNCIY
ncbi:uncharacterized protein LOC141655199 [Silene latifolia]|uniref:uncharacterized protein LOC141655199 n=1 Tax=Silene latifolia TaxID=37657 RepID=UPI003D78071F